MNYSFHLQDPTDPNTLYLLESVIGAIPGAVSWRGIYAFVSKGGVDVILQDPAVVSFLRSNQLLLVVGIDAVTNRSTLEALQEYQSFLENLSVRVFWNRTSGLFHPKISHFCYEDGSQQLIVRSGNLTPGGLRINLEAYSVLRVAANEPIDLSSWDDFIQRHAADLREIDEAALERASRNIIRGRGRRRRADVEPDVEMQPAEEELPGTEEPENILLLPSADNPRVLVAQVPKAGSRWHQMHFNREVIDSFFQVLPNTAQRVFLTEVRGDRSIGPQESHPCVFSESSNRNLKIEVAARHGIPYPDSGRPVAIFVELQVRTFRYMLLLPGEDGHQEMLDLSTSLPSAGRGLARVLTNQDQVRQAWSNCPLC